MPSWIPSLEGKRGSYGAAEVPAQVFLGPCTHLVQRVVVIPSIGTVHPSHSLPSRKLWAFLPTSIGLI